MAAERGNREAIQRNAARPRRERGVGADIFDADAARLENEAARPQLAGDGVTYWKNLPWYCSFSGK